MNLTLVPFNDLLISYPTLPYPIQSIIIIITHVLLLHC